ncbi:MAG: histidinol dehydrogenase [Calditrichaeota bacterium]|nr:MAG: histidinol dehydrogenase [Calditrichota bacterium]
MKIVSANEIPSAFFRYRTGRTIKGVREILHKVRQQGDKALKEYTRKFDGVLLDNFKIDASELKAVASSVNRETMEALHAAGENIRRFAEKQMSQLDDWEFEIQPGVFTGQSVVPIRRVGVYVPGGRFPLVSTLLMAVIPAQVAGVEEIAVCSPPDEQGNISPLILAAADFLGIEEVYRVGGAQAIAALAYGTESIPAVDKIVGPGNAYVAAAKKEVFGVVGIDIIAGPTEVMIIADESAHPTILAADLIAQAEHDEEAQPVLVTPSERLALQVNKAISEQLPLTSTATIARTSLERNGWIILVNSLQEAATVANRRAPEHLEVQVSHPEELIPLLKNYGSLFVGEWSGEVLGDYSAGINHTLPTNTTARYRGGLSVLDFLKIQTSLRVNQEGFEAIAPAAERLAKAEGLDGHFRSVHLRRLLLG